MKDDWYLCQALLRFKFMHPEKMDTPFIALSRVDQEKVESEAILMKLNMKRCG